MTREEWLASRDLVKMLELLHGRAGPRKFQLFACACLRRQLWDRTQELPFRRAVVYAERFALGLATRDEMRSAFQRAWPRGWERARSAAVVAVGLQTRDLHYWRCLELANEVRAVLARGTRRTESSRERLDTEARREQVALLHEVFGDPFETAAFDPAWRLPEVVHLAETLNDEGTFEETPVLADALQDAGCDREDVLAHLRGPSAQHVRGCWALDLILSHCI